ALKCLYLTVRSLDPTGRGQVRWTMRWKPALNAFAIPPPKKREAPPLSPTAGQTRKTITKIGELVRFLGRDTHLVS
ncbi:hypothetical protein FYJ24_12325, partial [Actinomycetaceae bacterium WB03_NA08]|nr:hypothetical protein [Scrofimicrobium canadense]